MKDVRALSVELVEAVRLNDIDRARALVAAGADPFFACAPVDVYVVNPGLSMKLGNGCAATQAIKDVVMLDAILPKKMDALPIVTKAISIWGVVSPEGEDVCLGQWAIEAGAPLSLSEIVTRLDRSKPEANRSLARLLRACAWGCNNSELSDAVYASLVMLIACKVDLEDDWKPLETVILREATGMSEGFWQYDNVPLTFSLMRQSADGVLIASMALDWLLRIRPSMAHVGLAPPSGMSLLHWAAERGGIEQVQMALDAGCDPSKENSAGINAIDVAIAANKADCAALMQAWRSSQAIARIRSIGAQTAGHSNKPTLTEEAA